MDAAKLTNPADEPSWQPFYCPDLTVSVRVAPPVAPLPGAALVGPALGQAVAVATRTPVAAEALPAVVAVAAVVKVDVVDVVDVVVHEVHALVASTCAPFAL